MFAELPNGDVRRGHEVFNRPKLACTACHAIGYLGGKVGPDLTRIGAVRAKRDLLEAIAFPSASFVRAPETV
jgi:putative heme-binding domain-containing protein